MKTIILLLALVALVTPASAQQDSVVFEYCYLNSSGNIDSRSIQIKLDFGTGTEAPGYLKDPDTGKPKKFNSVVDALNDMGMKGWELISVTAVSVGSGIGGSFHLSDHRYFFKRRRR